MTLVFSNSKKKPPCVLIQDSSCGSTPPLHILPATPTIYVFVMQENRFTKCNVCASIKEARERTLNPGLSDIMEKHMELQK